MRKHNRFYADVSVDLKYANPMHDEIRYLHDISVDGLCFSSDTYFSIGRIVTLEISAIKPVFRVKARVVWCQPNGMNYDIGVQFINVENGSCIRTVEFLQFLDQYKRDLFLSEGRKLTCEQIYLELSNKYGFQNSLAQKH